MVANNRRLHRSPRLSNMAEIDVNNWYQSTRGVPRACVPISRRRMKRFHRNQQHHDSDFWNQRQREVLQGLEDMKIYDQNDTHESRQVTLQSSRRMRRSRCYICYVRGHAYWNCPSKDRMRDLMKGKHVIGGTREAVENNQADKVCLWDVIGSDGKGWDEIWYVSDEHPRHMTPNLEVFEKFRRDTACSSTTSKSRLDIQGLGDVMVRTESHRFVIPGAFYVPNISLNILSHSQLIQQGFEVTVKDSKCIIKNMFDTTSSEEMEDEAGGKERMTGSKTEDDGNAYVEGQHVLDPDREKALRAIMRYYDSLYFKDAIIEEGEGNKQAPSKNDFESLIGFLHMIHEQEIIEECKGLVAEHFDKLVKWFYKDFMHCEERPTPVKINNTNVCLLDLYLTVKSMGGHARISIKNEWFQVACAMEFPKEYADVLKECYSTHLSLLAAYYEVARDYSVDEVVPEVAVCMGTSGVKAGSLPEEETTQDYNGMEARQMELDDEDGMHGKKIEFGDGEWLIISFEESKGASSTKQDADQCKDDGDNIIVVD